MGPFRSLGSETEFLSLSKTMGEVSAENSGAWWFRPIIELKQGYADPDSKLQNPLYSAILSKRWCGQGWLAPSLLERHG